MNNDLSQKTPTEKRWVAVSVLLMLILVVAVGVFYWAWSRSRSPVSITGDITDAPGFQTFEECFDSEESEVVYGKNYGDPAICLGPNGEQFTEPTLLMNKRYEENTDAYGPVESWQEYRNEEYGFVIKYPSGRYDLITEDYYWNPSAMLLRNKQNVETFYSFAIETPVSEQDAINRFGNDPKSELIQTPNGYIVLVILDEQDPYLPLIRESFKRL